MFHSKHVLIKKNMNFKNIVWFIKVISFFVLLRGLHDNDDDDDDDAIFSVVFPIFSVELEFRSVDFCGGSKTGEQGEKTSEQRQETAPN